MKPKLWKIYVDDTNVIWPHGEQELSRFLEHLNRQSVDIKFTMEVEENESIPFLDVLIYKRLNGSLGHKVFKKKTHTDNYLNADSHHHPTQKLGIINTLETRAARICDDEHLKEEHDNLAKIVKSIGYKENDIRRAIRNPLGNPKNPKNAMTKRGPISLTFKALSIRFPKSLKRRRSL